MIFERQIILVKLKGFLTGEVSKIEIYEWALSVAVSREYEQLASKDLLTKQIIEFLIEINDERAKTLPIRKILQYYVECLEGTKNFSSEQLAALLVVDKPVKSTPEPVKSIPPITDQKQSVSLSWLVTAAKVYALIFLTFSILMNFVAVIKPDFLVKPDEIAPTTAQAGKIAFPHLLYGVLMILALTMRVPRVLFSLFFPVAIWGMFFYWSLAMGIALKYSLSPFVFGLLLLLMALPPTAGFFILLNKWFSGGPKLSQQVG